MLGLILVGLVIRAYALAIPAGQRNSVLGVIASSHPSTVESRAMRLAGAAARGTVSTKEAEAAFAHLAAIDPLNSQPFLFFGALSERANHGPKAGALFQSALKRDPRSEAGHYFLITHSLRRGDVDGALAELSNLSRLNASAVNFERTFAAYARESGNAQALRAILDREPKRRDALLFALANDPNNADLIVELSGGMPPRSSAVGQDWRAALVQALANSGKVRDSRIRWVQLGGSRLPEGLATPGFGQSDHPLPFNWTFASGDAALVEPAANGDLNVLYFGRVDALLAGQTATLFPGRYLMSFQASGDGAPGLLFWQVECSGTPSVIIAKIPVSDGSPGMEFDVPIGCEAQQFQLRAAAGATDEKSRWTIGKLTVARVGA